MNTVKYLRYKWQTQWAKVFFTFICALHLPAMAHAQSQWTTNGNNINNTNTGNVGVGTATPTAKLEIKGANGAAMLFDPDLVRIRSNDDGFEFSIQGGSASNNGGRIRLGGGARGDADINAIQFFQGTAERMRINNGGNVGIGISTPQDRLDVRGGNISLPYGFGLMASGVINRNLFKTGYQSNVGDYLSIYTAGDASANTGEKIRILQDGQVGIGTTTPDLNYRLHVAGSVRIDGNIAAKYQDVAEWVETTQQLVAGTVVVLDTERSNQVLASTEAYDTKVAGVVSAQPGLILGEEGADKVKVATTGRVKVKVDATRGAIKVGDLLVTSGEEGYAMRSEPLLISGRKMHTPGTLIGKALEPLANGKGEILVLLSLQ